MKCYNCGNELSGEEKFCGHCGAPVKVEFEEQVTIEPIEQPVSGKAPKNKNGVKYVVIALVAIIALAGVGAGAFFAGKQDGLKNQEKAAEITEEKKEEVDTDEEDDGIVLDESEDEVGDGESLESPPYASNEYVTNIEATSYLDEPQYGITHYPHRVMDGDLSTAWSEGVNGQGIGESLTIHFDREVMFTGMEIYTGLQESRDLYYKNSRPENVTLIFSDRSSQQYRLEDSMSGQNVTLYEPVITTNLTIRIDTVYPGSKFEDTLITEIKLF